MRYFTPYIFVIRARLEPSSLGAESAAAPRSASSQPMGSGQYRILNNTAGYIGPWLALFREQPPNIHW